jgi:ATP-dependent DNA ligase
MSCYQGCGAQLSKEDLECKLGALESTGKYIIEEKLDGEWAQVDIKCGVVQSILSRNDKFKEYLALLTYKFPKTLSGILIGELAYGSSNVNMQKKIFIMYDFLKLDQYDATKLDNSERRAILEQVFGVNYNTKVCLVRRWTKNFYNTYRSILTEGNEGIIVKERSGINTFYKPGTRPENQIKVKKEVLVDMVVLGVSSRDTKNMSTLTKNKGLDKVIKNIICGQFRDGKLVKEVSVGSMTETERIWFTNNLNKVKSHKLVVEIKGYEQWQNTGAIRHPSLVTRPDGKWLREDLTPKDCVFGKIKII